MLSTVFVDEGDTPGGERAPLLVQRDYAASESGVVLGTSASRENALEVVEAHRSRSAEGRIPAYGATLLSASPMSVVLQPPKE